MNAATTADYIVFAVLGFLSAVLFFGSVWLNQRAHDRRPPEGK